MAFSRTMIATLAVALVCGQAALALTECPGSPTGAAQQIAAGAKPTFHVDSGTTSPVVFVKGPAGSAFTITAYGGSAGIDKDGDDLGVKGTGGCVEISVPPSAPYLGVFANGKDSEAHIGAVAVDKLSLRADGQGLVNSSAPFTADDCTFSTNGIANLRVLSGAATCAKLSDVFADGASNLLFFGTAPGGGNIKLINGQAYAYLGGVGGAVKLELMDGASKLRIAGLPGLEVSGKQLGAANDIKLLEGACKGLPRCAKVASDAKFWS